MDLPEPCLELQRLGVSAGPIAWTSRGPLVVRERDGVQELLLWTALPGAPTEICTLPGAEVRLYPSPDGRQVAITSDPPAPGLRLLDVESGAVRDAPEDWGRYYGKVGWSPDGQRIVVRADSGFVLIEVEGLRGSLTPLPFGWPHAWDQHGIVVASEDLERGFWRRNYHRWDPDAGGRAVGFRSDPGLPSPCGHFRVKVVLDAFRVERPGGGFRFVAAPPGIHPGREEEGGVTWTLAGHGALVLDSDPVLLADLETGRCLVLRPGGELLRGASADRQTMIFERDGELWWGRLPAEEHLRWIGPFGVREGDVHGELERAAQTNRGWELRREVARDGAPKEKKKAERIDWESCEEGGAFSERALALASQIAYDYYRAKLNLDSANDMEMVPRDHLIPAAEQALRVAEDAIAAVPDALLRALALRDNVHATLELFRRGRCDRETLVQLVRSKSHNVAAMALAEIASGEVQQILCDALAGTGDAAVRLRIWEELIKRCPAESLALARERWEGEPEAVRERILRHRIKHATGAEADDAALQATRSADDKLRLQGYAYLREKDEAAALEVAAENLDAAAAGVRHSARATLMRAGDRRCLVPLLRAFAAGEEEVSVFFSLPFEPRVIDAVTLEELADHPAHRLAVTIADARGKRLERALDELEQRLASSTDSALGLPLDAGLRHPRDPAARRTARMVAEHPADWMGPVLVAALRHARGLTPDLLRCFQACRPGALAAIDAFLEQQRGHHSKSPPPGHRRTVDDELDRREDEQHRLRVYQTLHAMGGDDAQAMLERYKLDPSAELRNKVAFKIQYGRWE